MKKRILLVMAFVMFLSAGYAQNTIWTKTDGRDVSKDKLLDRMSTPSHYHIFQLNLQTLKGQLANAPMRGNKLSSKVIIQFPNGDGELKSFKIYEAPVMQGGLAAKYPDMKSYVGQGVENPTEIIRFSITMYGLHNMMFTDDGTSYTDPYTKDKKTYIVYKRAAVEPRAFRCGVTDAAPKKKNNPQTTTLSETATDGVLRTYRLAMACTIEYAAFHIDAAGLSGGTTAEKTEAVLAAMNVTVTRVNSVYERDFSISLQLIDNNDQLIFIDSDNFDNENTDNALLDQSQDAIDNIVGFDSYDIGHVVSTGGGGVAQLYSPCSDSKARGITGLYAPVGDPYDIDFVAHEMGHQFGGNHTFNNSCDGNRNDGTAYETGSGTTIMAYAGVCFPSVQDHSDAHFHKNSITEITDFMKNWGNCSENTETGNAAPYANAGSDYVIPKGTPFILKGNATDEDNDAMTYCWEQMDLEISVQPPVADAVEGPNFRSLPPKDSPERYMPSLSAVLANNLAPTWEVVSNVARTFNFAFTVRDNNPLGGQTAYDDMQVTVSGEAGPFLVTAPNTNVLWQAGSNQTVTWDVAGTTENGVNTAYVDILFSNDGGQTYPVVLASKVPNDGSEVITVPTSTGSNKRIMVRAYDNIFYDLSNTNFTVTAASATIAIAVDGEQNKNGCKDGEVNYSLFYQALAGFTGETTFSVTGNPEGSTISFDQETINTTGVVTLTVSVPDAVEAGFYAMTVTATSGDVTKTANLYLNVIDTNFGTVTLTSPANGAEQIVNKVKLMWENVADATAYEVEVAADDTFENIIEEQTVMTNNLVVTLNELSDYYWRVKPINETCSGATSESFMFRTGETTCAESVSANVPVTISDSSSVTVNSTLTITGTEPISRLTVDLEINHTWVSDLTVVLKSPSGTQATLFQNVCDQSIDVAAVFDDYGTALVCGSTPAISGTVIPLEALSVFNGESPEGVWTLTINDNFEQDGGQLTSWSLSICNTDEPEVAGLQSAVFAGLSIYPNPNKGDFTIRFTSATGNDIKVSVYDMRGRQLLDNSFTNTGLIEQSLSLGNVQSGVYLVNIQDGESIVTKKIIIQ